MGLGHRAQPCAFVLETLYVFGGAGFQLAETRVYFWVCAARCGDVLFESIPRD